MKPKSTVSSKSKPKSKSPTTRPKKHMEPTQKTTVIPTQNTLGTKRAKLLIIIGAILVAVIVAGAYTYFHRKAEQSVLTPATMTSEERAQKLQALEAISTGTLTPTQRTTKLKALEKSSSAITTTTEERIQKLQALKDSSQ